MPENKKKKETESRNKIIRELAPFLNIGIQMVVAVGLGTVVGLWLDNSYGTKPVWTLLFTFLGVFLGFYIFFKAVSKVNKKK